MQNQGNNGLFVIVFHVFDNGGDCWTASLKKAIKQYKQFRKRSGCARLYIEIYADESRERVVYEECLLSVGDYPL